MIKLITIVSSNIEPSQYNAVFAITAAVRGTSREKLYQVLGFESLKQRRWYRKLCCLFKLIKNQSPSYLFQLVASPNTKYFARNSENTPQLRAKQHFFKNSLFPSALKELNNLGPEIRKSKSICTFKSNILKFIRPKPNNVYYCHNPKGISLITRLRLGLSHLREHSLSIAFRTASFLFASALMIMKLTTYFTVLPMQTKE